MEKYQENTITHEILTREEESELANSIFMLKSSSEKLLKREIGLKEFYDIQHKAQEARTRLIVSNRKFVIKQAQRYTPRPPITKEDLISEGYIGLINAIENFDPRCGKFSTFASYYINQAIILFLNYQGNNVAMPTWITEEISMMRKIQLELREKTNQEPSVEEISKYTGKSPQSVKTVINAMKFRIERASHIGSSDEEILIKDPKSIQPHEYIERSETIRNVNEIMNKVLDDRSRHIVKMYYGIDQGEPRTLEEVGKLCDLTKERIRQIVAAAKKALKEKDF